MGKRHDRGSDSASGTDRRAFLSNTAMGAGLVISHVTAAGFAVRYLYPVSQDRRQRLFVGLRSELPPGSALPFTAPDGRTINVIHGQHGFIALSDVCPHLGCRVHWEASANEFVCPCHDGHFDATGAPTAGPPADTGTPLSQYTIVEEGDLLFLEVEVVA